MHQAVSKNLSSNAQEVLKDLQKKIENEHSFAAKVAKAQTLWDSKKNSKKGKIAFEEITEILKTMCVFSNVCNYCEHSEATDIEHIITKSFFPSQTFRWINYVLICKICNTTYKSSKCYIFNNNDSPILLKRGDEPNVDAIQVFINPRIEDPNKFIILNLMTNRFMVNFGLTQSEVYKAEKTLEMLKLNERDTLIDMRAKTAQNIFDSMDRLIRALNANSIHELYMIMRPHEELKINPTLSLDNNKTILKAACKKDITEGMLHPSVWYAIKIIESKTNSKWQNIFRKIPEALTW
jgi:uncharacterized protein (TIGR02646 family)